MKKFSMFLVMVLLVMLVGCGVDDHVPLTDNPDVMDVNEVILSIEQIDITNVVTVENDPNSNLGTAHGYSGALFFRSTLLSTEEVQSTDIRTIDGGSIEIYTTIEDAVNREEFLALWDGSALAMGSHFVLGTLVIRVSNSLTADEQELLEQEIINKLK